MAGFEPWPFCWKFSGLFYKKDFAEDSHRELSCAAAQMIVAWATFEAEAAKLSPARRTTQPVSAAISATATNGSCSLRKKKFAHRQQFSVQ